MEAEIKEVILKEMNKRYRHPTVVSIHETKEEYIVEYLKSIGDKHYLMNFSKDYIGDLL